MWKLNFYLARTTLLSVLAVIAILLSIDTVVTIIVQMGRAGQGHFTTWTAIEFTLLRLPSDLYLILPICGFLGVLFGLGALASNSELIAMRAAGVSVYQISFGVILGAIVYVILALALSLYIAPATRNAAYTTANMATQNQAVLILAHASWIKAGNHFIYVGQTHPGGQLDNVTNYLVKNNRLISVTHASKVTVKQNRWILHKPVITDIHSTHITTQHLSTLQQPSPITTRLLKILAVHPKNMTIDALRDYIHYREKNNLDVQPYELQVWLRIFQPIAVLILMLLAIPFVFGPLRSASIGLRLMTGFVMGFAFFIINQFFGSVSLIYNFTPFWGAALPTILFTMLLLILLWRMD